MILSALEYETGTAVFLLHDDENGGYRRFAPLGKTFTLEALPERRCTGHFDLEAYERFPCPHHIELDPDDKQDSCTNCINRAGFNPAFYNAQSVSPQQRAYNAQPHIVYLAWFAPGVVKAGIAAARRGKARLTEQGARYAVIVGKFDDAYQARELEALLCSQEGIVERLTVKNKVDLLYTEPFDLSVARDNVGRYQKSLSLPTLEEHADLNRTYFADDATAREHLLLPEQGAESMLAGRCVGMIGSIAVMEQDGSCFIVPVKNFISHKVTLTPDQVLAAYAAEDKQLMLF